MKIDPAACGIIVLVLALLGSLLYLSKLDHERNPPGTYFSRSFEYFPGKADLDLSYEEPIPRHLTMTPGKPLLIRFFRNMSTLVNGTFTLTNATPDAPRPAWQLNVHFEMKNGDNKAKGTAEFTVPLQPEAWDENPEHMILHVTPQDAAEGDWMILVVPDFSNSPAVLQLAAANGAFPKEKSAENCKKLLEHPDWLAKVENQFWKGIVKIRLEW